jgi:hypothetical protein
MDNIIFKNSTMIRILAIQLLNIILLILSVTMKSLLKKWWCALKILTPRSMCRELKKLCIRMQISLTRIQHGLYQIAYKATFPRRM